MDEKIIKIAIVGQPGSGKDELGGYLSEKYSLPVISSGDFVREYITQKGLGGLERGNIQKYANALRKEHGGDYLVRKALEKAPNGIILTGLRTTSEAVAFKREGGTIIAVVAPQSMRYHRLTEIRKRAGDEQTFEQFCAIEDQESHSDDPDVQNTMGVIKMADHFIDNIGTITGLHNKADDLMFGRFVHEEFAQKA